MTPAPGRHRRPTMARTRGPSYPDPKHRRPGAPDTPEESPRRIRPNDPRWDDDADDGAPTDWRG